MAVPRALVTASAPALRRTVGSVFEEAGWEVRTADAGVDCVQQMRIAAPDLLVLVPPLLWGCVAGVLAVLHDDPATQRVPVLILSKPTNGSHPSRTPQLVHAGSTEGTEALPSLIDRLNARIRLVHGTTEPHTT